MSTDTERRIERLLSVTRPGHLCDLGMCGSGIDRADVVAYDIIWDTYIGLCSRCNQTRSTAFDVPTVQTTTLAARRLVMACQLLSDHEMVTLIEGDVGQAAIDLILAGHPIQPILDKQGSRVAS